MSRRNGPGGRLRPAPRTPRNGTRFESARPATYGAPRPVEGPFREIGTAPFQPSYDTPVLGSGGVDGPDDVDSAFEVEQGPSAQPVIVLPTEIVGATFEDERSPDPGAAPVAQSAPRRGFQHGPGPVVGNGPAGAGRPPQSVSERPAPTCTVPQLRRFIKSRAYVPMHELRRRFAIDGGDDDVTSIELDNGRIYVGLPIQEGHLLGDLLRGGEVGFELSMDPPTPVVVGVYAMRPVPRP